MGFQSFAPPERGPVAAAQQTPAQHGDRSFDQGFTLQGVSVLLGIVVAVLVILAHGRKVRRENDADARARGEEIKAEIRIHNDSVEKRLSTVETRITDFMPRAEIETKIDHEKLNRQQADQQVNSVATQAARDVIELKVSLGKIEQKQDGMANDMTELKTLVKDSFRDMNAKLDKQQECLNSISRKTA